MKRTTLVVFLGLASFFCTQAQVYTDTTGLIADLEAGIYEEYILAPASVTDTFFISDMVQLKTDVTIKAQDGLGFKPVMTGLPGDKPSYLFSVEEVTGGFDIRFEGIHVVSEIDGAEAINNGTFRIMAEDINLTVVSCEFFDFPSYNAVAKIYNSGGNITLDSVLVYNCAGKIVQVNYKDDNDTPNYVPLIGDLTVTNSTFAKVYKRIFFELGAGDVIIDNTDPDNPIKQRFNAGAENVFIDQCTFYGHPDVNVMQGRSFYEFAGDQTAVRNTMSITNTIFSRMGKNLNADSAVTRILDYVYFDFGHNLEVDETLEDFTEYNPTNTIEVDPVFADTANGAWDLTLQNETELMGSESKPIGDPRWWQGSYKPNTVQDIVGNGLSAKIYGIKNMVVIETNEQTGTITAYDITGRIMQTAAIQSSRTEIELPQGVFVVQIHNNKGAIAQKVLIK